MAREYYLFAGEVFAPHEAHLVTTVLGSCVSVCLWDGGRRLGGINHFISPSWDGFGQPTDRHGDIAIASLIRRMLAMGCLRENLRAKVFGGSEVLSYQVDVLGIGRKNIETAFGMLRGEHIKVVSHDVGGPLGRKLLFHTSDGSVLVRKLGPFHRHCGMGAEGQPGLAS